MALSQTGLRSGDSTSMSRSSMDPTPPALSSNRLRLIHQPRRFCITKCPGPAASSPAEARRPPPPMLFLVRRPAACATVECSPIILSLWSTPRFGRSETSWRAASHRTFSRIRFRSVMAASSTASRACPAVGPVLQGRRLQPGTGRAGRLLHAGHRSHLSGHERAMSDHDRVDDGVGHGAFARMRQREQSRRVLIATLALAGAACESTQTPRPYAPPSMGGTSGTGFDAGVSTSAPTIVILSPLGGALWSVTSAPEVRTRITATTGFLDPPSLRFSLTMKDAPAGSPESSGGALSGPFLNSEFTGRVDLAGLAGGSYTLTFTAATTTGASASAEIAVNVDAGPSITIIAPADASHQKGSLVVSVVVDSAPFGPTMTPIDATLAGRPINLQPTGTPNSYQGTVDFRAYDPPLSGDQLLTVAAKNANGTRTVATAMFVVDNDGPTIDHTSPNPSDVVGRVIDVRAHVVDAAGVLDSSVIALIGDQTAPQFKLNLVARGGGIYGAPFDTAQLTRCGLLFGGLPKPGTYCNVYPTVSFRASDALGNETTLSFSFGIDNQPPLLDLDPPQVRIARRKQTLQCSWAFDPLGDTNIPGNMPDDDCAVGQVFQLRARAEDDVNGARYLQVAPLATIDPTRIDVYVLNDTSQPLTVDSDGDGICDLINPKLVPTTSPPTSSREVLKIRLGAVPPQGIADFTSDPSLAAEPRCAPGDDVDLPPLLCRGEEPTIAISYGPKLPAIWSLEPIEPDGLRCFGNQFDAYANHIGGSSSRGGGVPAPGWACIAVQATDMVGNTGVSAPLRVWIDYDGNQACPAGSAGATTPPPDCTGRFNQQTGIVDGTRCTSRSYDQPAAGFEICMGGNCS